MRTPLILLAILVLGAVVFYNVLQPGRHDVAPRDAPIASAEPTAPVPDIETAAVVTNRARQIAPEQFAPPFAREAVRLERVAPRQPLTPPQSLTPPQPQTPPQPVDTTPKATLLHRPLVTAAGIISYPVGELRLEGIETLDPAQNCVDAAGAEWPCGAIARTAFRNFLRGRSLSCVVPPGPWPEPMVRSCMLGRDDPAAWLVRQGWARAAAGSSYAELEDRARQEQAGLHGSDPRSAEPVLDSRVRITLPPASPQEPLQ